MRDDAPYTRDDFDHSPLLVFYEVTRACDLLCRHCRADAQRHRDPAELTPLQARRLVAELTVFPRPPLLVLTGGDPLKRDDVFDLVAHAAELEREMHLHVHLENNVLFPRAVEVERGVAA